ncbi:MAG TPA: hypothetical protein VJM12_22140 [Pyrinomonadaceae bacterium]|nr:hypothetical protein [Pyrinomonadaceae bacterium]
MKQETTNRRWLPEMKLRGAGGSWQVQDSASVDLLPLLLLLLPPAPAPASCSCLLLLLLLS